GFSCRASSWGRSAAMLEPFCWYISGRAPWVVVARLYEWEDRDLGVCRALPEVVVGDPARLRALLLRAHREAFRILRENDDAWEAVGTAVVGAIDIRTIPQDVEAYLVISARWAAISILRRQ